MAKLFISHAAHDKLLVEAVVDLLEGGVGVPHRDIFCSSLKGQNIKPGEHFVDSIKTSLDEADCVLALISEAYYASAFCMCELGGVWLQAKSFLPVLVPPVDYANLKAVLGGLQVSKIPHEADLDELRDELVKRLGIEGHSTPRWTTKRKTFLKALPVKLKAVRFEGPVTRIEHNKLQLEFKAYQVEYEAREQEIEQLKKVISDLKKTKDAKAVAKVVRKHSSSTDVFESLVKAASAALSQLPRPVREALYYQIRGEQYYPKDSHDWDGVRRSVEYGQLELNADEDWVFPSQKDSKVGKAEAALDKLSEWLEEPADDFCEWYENTADGEQPDIRLRTFWERHFL